MREILLLSLIGFSLTTMARVKGFENIQGEWGTGGGNALVCFSHKTFSQNGSEFNIVETVKSNENIIPDNLLQYIESIEVYDLYEAKMKRGLSRESAQIVSIKKDEDIYDYLDVLARRYQTRVGYLGFLVREGKKIIPKSNIVFHEAGIQQQTDIADVILPSEDCVVSTMAAQINTNKYYQLFIDERLYDHPKHSKQSKATLILHELIYGFLRENKGHTSSSATRTIVRFLISYHEEITESSVAKSLNDLNVILDSYIVSIPFWGDLGQDPNDLNVLRFSDVSTDLKPFALSHNFYHYSDSWGSNFREIEEIIKKYEESIVFKTFYAQVLGLASIDGIEEPVRLLSSIGIAGKLIEEGLKLEQNNWSDMKVEFERIGESLKLSLETFLTKLPETNRTSLENLCGWIGAHSCEYIDLFEKQDRYLANRFLGELKPDVGIKPLPLYELIELYLDPDMVDFYKYTTFLDPWRAEVLVFNNPIPMRE